MDALPPVWLYTVTAQSAVVVGFAADNIKTLPMQKWRRVVKFSTKVVNCGILWGFNLYFYPSKTATSD